MTNEPEITTQDNDQLSKTVYAVSDNLSLSIETTNKEPLTYENITYALRIAGLLFDYGFLRQHVNAVEVAAAKVKESV